jgi:hypothetical protein
LCVFARCFTAPALIFGVVGADGALATAGHRTDICDDACKELV